MLVSCVVRRYSYVLTHVPGTAGAKHSQPFYLEMKYFPYHEVYEATKGFHRSEPCFACSSLLLLYHNSVFE